MPVTTYTVIDGVIVHEDRDGVQRNYRPDTNGNTVALTDATSVTDTWEYWPYGEVRSRTGTNPTPFQFGGVLGYYTDSSSRLYVRARHYRQGLGRWQTVDPLWPRQLAYGYVHGMPHQAVDPSGLSLDYGNWCGWNKRGPAPPIDALDRCCMLHDYCLAEYCDYFSPLRGPYCQCSWCWCLQMAKFQCMSSVKPWEWNWECISKASAYMVWGCLECRVRNPGAPPLGVPGW